MGRSVRGLLVGLMVLTALPAWAQTPPKVLMLGQDVKPGDHVTTAAGEQRALLSPDGASLTLAQNSELVLDKFAYDPAARSGELAVTVASGGLRLGGGMIVRTGELAVVAGASQVKIHAASAAIGVRPEGAEIRMLSGERVAVTALGETQTMTQPDSVITVPAGKPPSAPAARSANASPKDWITTFRDLDSIDRTTQRAV